MVRGIGFVRALLGLLAGPSIWAGHFGFVYGGHAALCGAGDRLPLVGRADLPWLLLAATGGAVMVLLALALSRRLTGRLIGTSDLPEEADFLVRVARLLSALSLFGVLASGAGMIVLPGCQLLR